MTAMEIFQTDFAWFQSY